MPDTVLTPLERRVVGNLSVPRNLDDLRLELLRDPVAGARLTGTSKSAPIDLEALVAELVDSGLIVRLGSTDDLAKLAAGLERKANVVAMHDDKANNWIRRLDPTIPRNPRAWRGLGELLIYTDAAHELLTGPVIGLDAPDLLDRAELELRIAQEAARVNHALILEGSVTDVESYPGAGDGGGRLVGASVDDDQARDAGDVELADALLVDEFRHWEAGVLDHYERETGERLKPFRFIVGGSYGDATELLILAAETGGTAYGETSPTYGALTTVAVTDADTGSTITRAAYTGYADKSIANTDYNAPSAGAHTNVNAITWAGATAGSSTCIGFARVTTSGGGRLIRRASITSVIVSATNTPASIAAASLSESLD